MKHNKDNYSYKIYKIKGEHYVTGEVIIIHESIFINILEVYIDFFEDLYCEYRIYIDE
jgi:hypothetical protein